MEAALDQELAARLLRETGLLALPVVDAGRRLVGVITADDMADVLIKEASEDFERLGGQQPLEEPDQHRVVPGPGQHPPPRPNRVSAADLPHCVQVQRRSRGVAIRVKCRCGGRDGSRAGAGRHPGAGRRVAHE